MKRVFRARFQILSKGFHSPISNFEQGFSELDFCKFGSKIIKICRKSSFEAQNSQIFFTKSHEVKNAALQVGVDCSKGLPRVSSSSQFKNPCVPLPEKVDGGAVDQMTVTELRDVLGNAESAEAAWPFLLRFVLGEFHYGQRVTGLQPGQKPGRASSVSGSTLAGTGKDDEALDPITKQNLKAFDVMAAESRYRHLHQVSEILFFSMKI